MSALRLTGLLASLVIFGFVALQYRRSRYRRGDLLLGIAIAGSLAAVSLFPSVVDGISALFHAPTRLMALAILSSIVLFLLNLVAFREISDLRSALGELVRALAREDYGQEQAEQPAGEIVVVIPAFDEERNLKALLPQMPGSIAGKPLSALVIVDGARDLSASVARSLSIPMTSHVINRGGGAAVKTGFELALQAGAGIVVTMDADGQHDPGEIERIVGPLLADRADVVLGNRFSGDYAERGSFRHAGIVLFSALVSLLAGTRIHDCTNGFRAIRSSALRRLDLREEQFHTAEFIMEAAGKRLRISEVPVSVLRRRSGESKKPAGIRYPLGFAWTLLRVWLRS